MRKLTQQELMKLRMEHKRIDDLRPWKARLQLLQLALGLFCAAFTIFCVIYDLTN